MIKLNVFITSVIILSLIAIGCSKSSSNPVTPTPASGDLAFSVPEVDTTKTNRELLGVWNVNFDTESLKATVNYSREIAGHVNITSLVPIKIKVNSFDSSTMTVDVDVTISNPYNYTGYDVRLIVFTDDIGHLLKNADSWTPLWDIPGGKIINPFKAYAKSETNRIFASKTEHTENLKVYLPGLNTSVKLAVDASFPGNCQEPYSIENLAQDVPLLDYVGAKTNLSVDVYDWQNDTSFVAISCPAITNEAITLFQHDTGNTWSCAFTNETGATPGVYPAYLMAASNTFSILFLYNAVNIEVVADLANFDEIVDGVNEIASPGAPGPVWPEAPEWKSIAAGDEDTTFPSLFSAARIYEKGRVLVMGHDGLILSTNLLDNGKFMVNVVKWLETNGLKKVYGTRGHSEWVNIVSNSDLIARLNGEGYSVTNLYAPITTSSLSDAGVLIVGNASSDFTAAEIEAVRGFVANGGGVCLLGLGWPWEGPIEDYPMMRMAAPYEIRWLRNLIWDETNYYQNSVCPIFHTFYPNISFGSLSDAIDTIYSIHETYPTNLKETLESNSEVRYKMAIAHQIMAVPSNEFDDDDPDRVKVYNTCIDLLQNYPDSYARIQPFDKNAYPTSAYLRERLWRTLRDCLELDSALKAEIASAGQLFNRRLDIFNDFGIILCDNVTLNDSQLDVIYNYYNLLPDDMQDMRCIGVNDYLGTPAIPINMNGKPGAVNIFGPNVGQTYENSFPSDVPPGYVDGFSVCLAHETNHVVIYYVEKKSSAIKTRREQLISQAGSTDWMNYLRGNPSDPAFFYNNPQEFFASISNQWFANSAKVFDLGYVRFQGGRPEPMNQALFFAEVYSKGTNSVPFYVINTSGNIQKTIINVTRDTNNHINSFNTGTYTYDFVLDSSGNVISVNRY